MSESPAEGRKPLSRRGFLKVLMVQAGAAALLSACQQAAPAPTAAPAASKAEAPAAKPTEAAKPAAPAAPAAPAPAAAAAPGQTTSGGKLKVGVPSNANTMDPHKQKIGEEYLVAFMVTEALVVIDGDMTPKPQLAESWTNSDDLRTWTFKLVKGARFHDGRELTPDDVIASFKRILDPATGSPARSNLGVIEDISAPDGNTVKFSLKQPYGDFAAALGERNAKIMPKDKLESAHTMPIGTGPFKFVSFTPGQASVIAKNPDYREKGVPKLDEVTFRIIPEASAAATALQTGELDMYWQVPLESIESLQSAGIVIDEVPTSSWDAVIMRCDEEPFDNLKLRQAVFYAADRDQLVKGAALGHGTPTYTSVPPNSVAYNKSLALKPDLTKAKQMLSEAGYPNGIDIELYIPEARPTRERLGIIMQQMLTPVGFRIKLQRVPWDKFVADIEGKTKFNVDGFFSRPTLDTATYPFYHSTGSWNTITWHYSNKEVDSLLEQARSTADQAKASEAYQKFQEVAHLEGPGLVPYVLNHVVGTSKKVKDFKAHSMLWLDLRNTSIS